MTDDENQPGPEPKRLQIPRDDWKEALRRALGAGGASETETESEPDTDLVDEDCGDDT